MVSKILKFSFAENGSVTTDWVVLAASLVTLCIIALHSVSAGATQVADTSAAAIGAMEPGQSQ